MRVKLIVLVIFAACMQVSATSFAQYSVKAENKPLSAVLEDIQSETGMVFMYNNSVLVNTRPVTADIKNGSLNDILIKVLENENLNYKIIDKTIVLSLKPVSAPLEKVIDIAGTVYDETGKPMQGVTIRVLGSQNSVASDNLGHFALYKVDNRATLEFAFIGYAPIQLKVQGHSSFNVTMKPASNVLDEVVAVGYGTTKRKDLTGSVSSINVPSINNTPLVTIDQALAGKAAGVQITSADGSPGGVARIRVRGGTSLLGGNDPLYIIDGVQMTVADPYVTGAADVASPTEFQGGGDISTYGLNTVASTYSRGVNTLAGLNINDIESIDILKDASATAIYGSKAANGVVIITTKKGKKNQKPTLEAGYYTGFSNAITEKLLNAAQYKQVYLEGAANTNNFLKDAGLPANAAATAILNDPSVLGTANTDWLKLITRVGRTQNADVNISGGGSGSSFYTSLAYNNQTGTLLGTDFRRISGKVNLDNEINSKVKLNTNIDYSFTNNNVTNGVYSSALYMPPTIAPYTNGIPTVLPVVSFSGSTQTVPNAVQNPLALLQGKNQANTASLLGSLTLEYDIVKDLTFRSTASVNYSNYHQLNYTPSTVQAYYNSSLGNTGGVGSQGQGVQTDMFFENTLTYDKTFDKNNHLTFLAGTSWEHTKYNSFSASGEGFPDDTYLTGLSSAATYLQPTSTEYVSGLLSFYLRANYTFKDRYLLTVTGRADESSKFPSNNRTGYFPSFGLAWKINEESFLKNVTWIDELKIRASAGYTGTQNIGNNLFYTLYTPGSYASTNALLPTQLGNDRLKWESTLQKDAGIDFSLFNARLSGSIGYYNKHTSGILLAAPQPSSTGFSSALENVADINNKGLEIELSGDIIRKKQFSWNIDLNVSGNRSLVTRIAGAEQNPSSVPNTDPELQSFIIGNTVLEPGKPVGEIYGYIYQGVIKTQAQLNQYKSQAFYAQLGFLPDLGIGSPMYALYTSGNYKGFFKRDVIGNAQPKFYGGLTNTFNYKQFSLTALFTYSYGGQLLYLPSVNSFGLGTLGNKNTQILQPTYSASNTGANRPTIYLDATNNDGAYGATSANVFNDSYIKLKSLYISYKLPDYLLNKLGIKSAMIYVAGSNLFAITKYPGPDPEVSNDPYSLINGYTDDATYPTMRQYTIGARFRF